jgi:hypothetical protein
MSMRTLTVAALVIGAMASSTTLFPTVNAQSCNTSPNRPTTTTAARSSDGSVLVAWTMSGGCAAEKFYLEASRGTTDVIEETIDDGEELSATLDLDENNGTPWRISVRAFNEFGLSAGRSAILDEGSLATTPPPPNSCPAGPIPPPTLVSAQSFGRTLFVQWQPDWRCTTTVTGFVIGGSLTPDGPIIGTITIPYPNIHSWTGEVPPGSYFVSVFTQYYGSWSVRSNTMLVHVQ